jgi:hypothetical protein
MECTGRSLRPTLPEEFKKISRSSIHARACWLPVPGTHQAAEAVLLGPGAADCARVNRKEIQAPEIIYQGEPQYEPIQGTQLQRAVNTDKQIHQVR